MPHKVDAVSRCADLLAALARTANVRLALKETGVSACWAYRRRRADPDFKARWRTAIKAGRRSLVSAAAAAARDPDAASPGAAAGLTLVGSIGKGTLRLEPEKRRTFTASRLATFLDALRATCNVRAAARTAGVSPTIAYGRYHADAAFRAHWEAALVEGRVHLEMALIGAARALFETPEQETPAVATPPTITGMDAKVALQLLRLHAPRDVAGRPRGRWVKPADADATRREILAKVAAVRAARAGSPISPEGDAAKPGKPLPGESRGAGHGAGLGPGVRRGGASGQGGGAGDA